MHTKESAEKKVRENIGSLEKIAKEAICTADINLMLAIGFPTEISVKICEIIKEEAKSLGINNLRKHYEASIEGKSNIINTIVRRKHKVYFATRSNLHPLIALEHFESEPNDICSVLFKRSINKSNEMKKKRREALLEKQIKKLARESFWLQDGEGDKEDNDSCSLGYADYYTDRPLAGEVF